MVSARERGFGPMACGAWCFTRTMWGRVACCKLGVRYDWLQRVCGVRHQRMSLPALDFLLCCVVHAVLWFACYAGTLSASQRQFLPSSSAPPSRQHSQQQQKPCQMARMQIHPTSTAAGLWRT